jgi:hypothetical protein
MPDDRPARPVALSAGDGLSIAGFFLADFFLT